MSEHETDGHPFLVMAAGGFIGGLVAGGNNAGFFGFLLLSMGASFGLSLMTGSVDKSTWKESLPLFVGLSTTIPLPAGGLGFLIGRALWGA